MKVTIPEQEVDIELEEIAYCLAQRPMPDVAVLLKHFYKHLKERTEKAGLKVEEFVSCIDGNLKDFLGESEYEELVDALKRGRQ